MNNVPGSPSHPQQRLQWLEEVFHEASQLAVEERFECVRSRCIQDPSLIAEVMGLLEAESAISELKSGSGGVGDQTDLLEATSPERWSGRVLGGYRLEKLLGRGGMGLVYLASRRAGDLSQRVAVKLMAYHLQSTPAQKQFLMERQALAELEHSNITRLLDGGVTEEGLPYLVMEFVEGRRLDEICDAEGVSLDRIARLMLPLCDAVSYVHRNLILHRDLKPGNVMVTDEGVVKLLDFGTFKGLQGNGLGGRFAGDSAMTQAGMRSLTLRYASPEQIRGDLPSTAMDVYSLGMILYRLIAGQLPAGMAELSPPEYLKVLEHEAFAAPSRSGPLQRRQLDAALAADLDAIALKSIGFRAEDRYHGVEALAADLRSALERRPVEARKATPGYRAKRFMRRNRTLALGSAAAMVVLAMGFAGMAYEAKIARQQSVRAEAGVEEERKLAHLLLSDYFNQLRDIPGSTRAQTQAVSRAVAYLDALNRTSTQPSLQLESLQAYRKMGSLLGSPYEANLGDAPEAIRTLERGQPLVQKLLAVDPRNLDYLTAAAGLETATGQVYLGEGDGQRALPHLLAATGFVQRVAENPHASAKMLIQSAAVYKTLADAYGEHGDASTRDPAKVVASLERSGAYYERALTLEPHCCQRGLTIVQMTLGELEEDIDADQAIASYQKGLAVIASLPRAEQQTVGFIRLTGSLIQRLGTDELILHHRAEGEAILLPEFQTERHAITADPVDTRARTDLIDLDFTVLDGYRALGDKATQEMLLKEYLENLRVLTQAHPDNTLWRTQRTEGQLRLADLLQHEQRASEAHALAATALPTAIVAASDPKADAATLQTVADGLLDLGNEHDRKMALSFARRLVAADLSAPTASHLLTLAKAEQAAGYAAQAAVDATAALRDIKAHPRRLDAPDQMLEVQSILPARLVN